MSNEENTKQEEIVQEEIAQDENVTQPADSAKNTAGSLVSSFLSLKETNPKVFFGSIGGVVILLVLLMTMGDDSSKPTISGPALKDLAIGQRYTLKSANAYDAAATVRLVVTPGAISAYDDTEEKDRSGACQHIAQGTPVSVLEFADAYGKQKTYAKVRIEDGECKGNEAWALAIDIQ
ncbi:hypothetical protein [Methylobacter sp. S3L5C]|uniref:hypothetical protein n=1 Tax=Methylobacter sp. S3L5C TaxID=2839024 RepID=UPI001FADBF46|nr:hypothetical protein [Methylobacter sp. S3L5C]UOA09846.1 hypothetical protein KKZ03_06190 [Methylobacter sp. S3L5C]